VGILYRISNPSINSQGLWIDLDIIYEGNVV